MNTFIVNSTAAEPLGLPTGRKCFTLAEGNLARRLALVYAASAGSIAVVWADPPYESFSSPVVVVSDSADMPFDAALDDNGDIGIVYTIASSGHVAFVRLSCTGGGWTAGTPVTIYDGADNRRPQLCRLSTGRLWVAFTRYDGDDRSLSVKYSDDGGETWGGVSVPGDTLVSGDDDIYGQFLESMGYVTLFFSRTDTGIGHCRTLAAGASWTGPEYLATGEGFSEHLSVAASADGRIAASYRSTGGLKLREFSGVSWSAEHLLDDAETAWPQASYQGGIAYVIYTRLDGDAMNPAMYTRKLATTFSPPEPLDDRRAYLKRLLVYDESAGSLQDRTAEASSAEIADVTHSGSGALLAATGDSVFFGMDRPFAFLRCILSTSGAGGEVLWRYFDGQTWQSFAPASGPWHFTTAAQDILLWSDFASIPVDWQKKTIDGHLLYWVAATVTTTFSTPPVGSRLSAIPNLQNLSCRGYL